MSVGAANGTVLVTGGTGYVAGYCIERLLADGWTVRATARDPQKGKQVAADLAATGVDTSNLNFMPTDLESDKGWDAAVAGCSYILHVASPIPAVAPKHEDELMKPAREGTLRVLEAAARNGVRRVVMTSSGAAISYGLGSRNTPFTEEDWSRPDPQDTTAYERSKLAAERAAWQWTSQHDNAAELVTICPGAMIGPAMGVRLSTSIQIIKKLIDGSLPGLPKMSFPLVDVRDVADLHVRAMTSRSAAGQRYIGAGPTMWMADIAQVIRDEVPKVASRVPRRTLPNWLVRASALFDPVTRARLFELGKFRMLSSEKARLELNWEVRPTDVTIKDTVKSLMLLG